MVTQTKWLSFCHAKPNSTAPRLLSWAFVLSKPFLSPWWEVPRSFQINLSKALKERVSEGKAAVHHTCAVRMAKDYSSGKGREDRTHQKV